mmetsp:Transcript_10694/g.20811  ORF Transcript_10694/g.20811 Transcript_10694/m.20811 type:complete len:433 (-) Transcript_10694:7-1305(-)
MTDFSKAQQGAYKVLALLLDGLVEALPYEQGLLRLEPHLPEILETLISQMKGVDLQEANEVVNILETLTTKLKARKEDLVDYSALQPLVPQLLELILSAEGFLLSEKTNEVEVKEAFTRVLADMIDIVGEWTYTSAYENLVTQLSESAVESWSVYEIKWRIFQAACTNLSTTKSSLAEDTSISILARLVDSGKTQKLHLKVLTLTEDNLKHHHAAVPQVLVPCLLRTTDQGVVSKALDILTSSASLEIVTPSTFKGLLKAIDPPNQDKGLQTAKVFMELLASSQSESILLSLKDGDSYLCPAIFSKVVDLLQSPNEQLASLALSLLEIQVRLVHYSPLSAQQISDVKAGRLNSYKYANSEYETAWVGSYTSIFTALVSIVLGDEEGEFKYSCKELLSQLCRTNPQAALAEALKSKRSGHLKRWDLLESLFLS